MFRVARAVPGTRSWESPSPARIIIRTRNDADWFTDGAQPVASTAPLSRDRPLGYRCVRLLKVCPPMWPADAPTDAWVPLWPQTSISKSRCVVVLDAAISQK